MLLNFPEGPIFKFTMFDNDLKFLHRFKNFYVMVYFLDLSNIRIIDA